MNEVVVFAEAEPERMGAVHPGAVQQAEMEMIGEEDPDLHVAVGREDTRVLGAVMRREVAPEDLGSARHDSSAPHVGRDDLFDHLGVARALSWEHQHDRRPFAPDGNAPGHSPSVSARSYRAEMPSAKVLPRSTVSTC